MSESEPQPSAKRIAGAELLTGIVTAGALLAMNGLPASGREWARNTVAALAGALAAAATVYLMKKRAAKRRQS